MNYKIVIITVLTALISLIGSNHLSLYAKENKDFTTPTGFIRELTDKEQYTLFLMNEVFSQGLQWKDFTFLLEAIDRESEWDIKAINNNLHRNGTISTDFGLCQINDKWWSKRANELNLDFYNDVWDNLRMCVVVMKEQGRSAFISMKR